MTGKYGLERRKEGRKEDENENTNVLMHPLASIYNFR